MMKTQNHSSPPIILTLLTGSFCMLYVVCCLFLNQLFQKILSGTQSECQTVWIQIRSDILSGLVWVYTVCKDMSRQQNLQLAGKGLIIIGTTSANPRIQINKDFSLKFRLFSYPTKLTFGKKIYDRTYNQTNICFVYSKNCLIETVLLSTHNI